MIPPAGASIRPSTGFACRPIAVLVGLFPILAFAEGNLAKRAERLDLLVLDAADGFSIRRYEIEAGKFYCWR